MNSAAAPATIPELLLAAASPDRERTAVHYFRDKQLHSVRWGGLARDVAAWADVLTRCGVQRGDRVVQVSANRYEWIVADLAIAVAGGVHVPIHSMLSGAQVAYQIADCEPRAVFVENREIAKRIKPHSAELPNDLHWMVYDPWWGVSRWSQRFAPIAEAAADFAGDPMQMVRGAADASRADELATILYTSGTTGDPRGVMLTQNNVVSNAIAVSQSFQTTEDDLFFNLLPLSHIYARTCDLYVFMYRRCELFLSTSKETIIAEIGQVHPTLINAVPYFYDKVRKSLNAAGKADSPGALGKVLGGAIRLCFCGGAALPEYVQQFYADRGVLLLQGYGLTESSPVISASTPDAYKLGSVGQAVKGVEVRIADDGEILTRGPHVMRGYWKNPELTSQMIEEGWLHTGDFGSLDDEDYLYIRGRKKEILVTAAGKNIVPTHLERLITHSPLVAQVMVIGDGRNYLTALIVPDPDALRAEIIRRKIRVFTAAQALAHPKVAAIYREELDRTLAEVSHYEQVRRFALLDRGFSIELGEMTAKLSLRRETIAEHFAGKINMMYASDSGKRAS